MSDVSIKPSTTSNKLLNPSLNFVGTKARVKFNGDSLKQEKITFNHGKIVNVYIVYQIEKSVNISRQYKIVYLVQLSQQSIIMMLICINIQDMVLGLIEKDFFSIDNEIGRNVIIFRVDMSSSAKIDNRKKKINS